MRTTRRRAIAIIIALATLFAIDVAPASAITLQRTWTAKIGSGGVNGRVVLKAYTNGVGSIQLSLKGLKQERDLQRPGPQRNVRESGHGRRPRRCPSEPRRRGTAAGPTNLLPYQMTSIWAAARKSSFIVRIVSGSSIKCGAFHVPPCDPRRHLDARHQPRRSSAGPTTLSEVQGRDVHAVGRPATRARLHVHLRPRTDRHVPADADQVPEPWCRGPDRPGRQGLHERQLRQLLQDRQRHRRPRTSFGGAYSLDSERLRLQTSTGPNHTYPKLIADAMRYKTVKTTYAASHPTPHPVSC